MARIAALLSAFFCIALSGCTTDALAGHPVSVARVLTSPNPWPTPQSVRGGPPRILAFWMNRDNVPNGTDWFGRIVTTTNVASVEVRTESFSFNAQRTAFGVFTFRQHVLDWVPQYKRAYTLQVIARNAGGAADTILVPISFQ